MNAYVHLDGRPYYNVAYLQNMFYQFNQYLDPVENIIIYDPNHVAPDGHVLLILYDMTNDVDNLLQHITQLSMTNQITLSGLSINAIIDT
jgi:hypothetical protein